MYRAVLDRAARQRPFRAKVDRSALRILRVKEEHGLL
jgi:hypothetical protein